MITQLTEAEENLLVIALEHQIKHDQRRVRFLREKHETPTQDITFPQQRALLALEMIRRIQDGKIYSGS